MFRLYVTPDYQLTTTTVDGPHAVLILGPVDPVIAALSEECPVAIVEYQDPFGILAKASPDILQDIGRRASHIAQAG